ncbi:MAG: CAT RNA binding domain-containing protein [Roseburia inulinivorans]
MVIQKVINNNVISAYDENQQEVVIMGKGIGFKAHTGDAIDESRIEKVFGLRTRSFPAVSGDFREHSIRAYASSRVISLPMRKRI